MSSRLRRPSTSTAHSSLYGDHRVLTLVAKPENEKPVVTVSRRRAWFNITLQALIVAATSAQILLWAQYESPYDRAVTVAFDEILVPAEAGDTIFKVSEVLNILDTFTDAYFAQSGTYVDRFEYPATPGAPWVDVEFAMLDGTPSVLSRLFKNNRTDFDSLDINTLIREAKSMTMDVELISYSFTYQRSCLIWNISATLDFEPILQSFVPSLDTYSRFCPDTIDEFRVASVSGVYIALRWSILCLSVISMLLLLTEIGLLRVLFVVFNPRAAELQNARWVRSRRLLAHQVDWSAWHFFDFISDAMNIIGASLAIYNERVVLHEYNVRFFIGFGCLLSWIMLCEGIGQLGDEYFGFFLAYKKASAAVGHFLISVFPIFIGFCLFGVFLFGAFPGSPFSNVDNAAAILFAVLMGDSVRDTFIAVSHDESYFAISRIFMYGYSFFFLNLVTNLLLVIIQYRYFLCIPPESEEAGDFFDLADGGGRGGGDKPEEEVKKPFAGGGALTPVAEEEERSVHSPRHATVVVRRRRRRPRQKLAPAIACQPSRRDIVASVASDLRIFSDYYASTVRRKTCVSPSKAIRSGACDVRGPAQAHYRRLLEDIEACIDAALIP